MNMENFKPTQDWGDSVSSIISMGKFLYGLRDKFTREELCKMALVDYGISASSVEKLINISRHQILSDPRYADQLPSGWTTLYELKFMSDDLLLDLIQSGQAKTINKYQIWELRGVRVKRKKNTEGRISGAKVEIDAPQGGLIQFIKAGIMREPEYGGDIEATAKAINVARDSYRKLRSVILLSQRPELTEEDRKFVDGIIDKIEKTRNVRTHYRMVKPLLDKVWGNSRNKTFNDKSTQKRIDAYKDAVFILGDSCRGILMRTRPYMSEQDTNDCITELTEASRLIRQLAEQLRRSKDD